MIAKTCKGQNLQLEAVAQLEHGRLIAAPDSMNAAQYLGGNRFTVNVNVTIRPGKDEVSA